MDAIIKTILDTLADLGYWGIAIGLMIEVIPSEIVLAYGGYLISIGKIGFPGALIAGIIGGTLAQIFLYWIGYYGGRPFLQKYGRYLLINQKHLDISERWFERHGTGIVFTARFIPVIRHAISIPAGIAKMSLLRFTVLTVLAMIPWSILFLYLGMQLGNNWADIKTSAQPFIGKIMLGAIAAALLYAILQIRKKRRTY
ncbi:hypothetical protein BEP19_10295 [Ammoniphilus oxalaticus]|uniref:VTT domain-containing protein n=1 Tax=Ammoniphilus oxalaticus TaxID=66863 RepID=A0A419SFT1_9BACL|nr:DedA family protein [Ammoniphilus oxalaticus]RKD22642.1 hypothetical protein BEP19_10295 [Ammoniphilus oxalaticus]